MLSQSAFNTRVEQVFAEIAAAIEVGLYVFKADDDALDPGAMRLVYANTASVKATGAEVAAILGKSLDTAFPELMKTPLPGIALDIALGGEARRIPDIEYEGGPVGKQVFSALAFPLTQRRVGIAFSNLTARRIADQQAVQTLESMSDAFVTLDADWRFTYLNPQSEAILDRRREDLLGKNIWEEFPEAVGSRFYDEYHRAVRDQVTIRLAETYDPLGRVLDVRAYPTSSGLAVYFRDVTNEHLSDAKAKQAQRLEAIGRVTTSVAHDFSNLLTVIRGFADLGEGASSATETDQYFAEIGAAADKATELTRQLLTFAREQELKPEVSDLNDIVRGFAPILRHLVPTETELTLELDADPVPIYVDRARMEQVILNLVLNSRDAITESGTIVVETSTNPPAGLVDEVTQASACLRVTDTGSGIADELLPHIFDPFFSTKPREAGTGLGLATIYGIVTQSGGHIDVDTTVGSGTTMTIVLPAQAAVTG